MSKCFVVIVFLMLILFSGCSTSPSVRITWNGWYDIHEYSVPAELIAEPKIGIFSNDSSSDIVFLLYWRNNSPIIYCNGKYWVMKEAVRVGDHLENK
jgi:hypothetical protein